MIAGLGFGSTIIELDSNVPNADTKYKEADVVCAKQALKVLLE